MNFWDSAEKLSFLVTIANWVIAGTLLVAFLSTVVTIKAGNRRDELLAAESQKLQTTLKTNVEALGERVRPRSLNQYWAESLKEKPTGSIELWYEPEDQEAYTLAFTIRNSLANLGWKTADPIPIPEKRRGVVRPSANLPTAVRLGTIGIGDTVLRVRQTGSNIVIGENTAEGALRDAILFGINGTAGGAVIPDPALADGHVLLIVLKK